MSEQQGTAQQALTRRITGIETEFGITLTLNGSRRLGPDEIARYMFRPVIAKYGATNIFTPNAGRLYLDVGSHPEFATAECDSVSQLVAHDRAGEVILDRLAVTAEAALADEGIGGKLYLLKNNVDTVGNSYGCHENYLVGRELGLKSLSKLLLPFLVTRQLICGAGKIFLPYPTSPYHNDPVQYCFSQRADHVWEGVSSATTRSRPIINTRDEPHADSNRFRRLHVIVGDSNMSETTTALKIGSTQLVLEMIEAGVELPDFEVANEIKSIRAVSRDMTGRAEIPLRDGGTATALEIQYAFLTAAKKWLEVREETTDNADKGISGAGTPNAEMARIVELWERTLTAVDSGDWSLIERDIDWAIKYSLIKRYLDRGLTLENPKLAQIDLAYHDIRPGRGIFRALEARGAVSRWITDADIEAAVDRAPQTTRAKLRGDFLAAAHCEAAHAAGLKTVVDWTHLKIAGDNPQSVMLGDPFATDNSEVTEMIATLSEGSQEG
ncbi:Pup--protein ligase [Corynebacterium lactis]|uniref:Pup--protein ligase n=1 Tax=Corynebacterium lactis RW2-5 TaxID=1408189 RepID=A0A0K2H081_9CORY|nr:Pup--protein ligase [Corynebacterium lactis]ALA67439.1 Pup--protein ligase [Corynebacterium lactis RW2-5]